MGFVLRAPVADGGTALNGTVGRCRLTLSNPS